MRSGMPPRRRACDQRRGRRAGQWLSRSALLSGMSRIAFRQSPRWIAKLAHATCPTTGGADIADGLLVNPHTARQPALPSSRRCRSCPACAPGSPSQPPHRPSRSASSCRRHTVFVAHRAGGAFSFERRFFVSIGCVPNENASRASAVARSPQAPAQPSAGTSWKRSTRRVGLVQAARYLVCDPDGGRCAAARHARP